MAYCAQRFNIFCLVLHTVIQKPTSRINVYTSALLLMLCKSLVELPFNMYAYTHTHTHTYIYIYIILCIYIYLHISYKYMCVYTYLHTYIMYTHTYIGLHNTHSLHLYIKNQKTHLRANNTQMHEIRASKIGIQQQIHGHM